MDQQPPGSPQGPRDQGPQDAGSLPGCYRHPDREAGVRCTRCERPICPECMVSASVGFQCPDCVRGGSGTGHAPAANQPRTLAGGTVAADPRLVTKVLIGLNLALYLVQAAVGDAFTNSFDLFGRAWLSGEVQGVAEGQWYRMVTSMFLHGGVMHILFNMVSLWWIGGPLEAALGRARYITLYFVSGLAGSALSYLLASPQQPSLGASGAIFGLFGATAVLMRRPQLRHAPGHRPSGDQPDLHLRVEQHRLAGAHRRSDRRCGGRLRHGPRPEQAEEPRPVRRVRADAGRRGRHHAAQNGSAHLRGRAWPPETVHGSPEK